MLGMYVYYMSEKTIEPFVISRITVCVVLGIGKHIFTFNYPEFGLKIDIGQRDHAIFEPCLASNVQDGIEKAAPGISRSIS